MRLVHTADLHLGHRRYDRMTRAGINQREADVARTFHILVDRVIALAPDLIVIGGDIFDMVRPSNNAVIFAFNEFSRLSTALPHTPIVLIGGNHDTPRSTEAGGLLQLFARLGIHVVDRETKRLTFPDLNLSVLAVPDVPGLVRPKFDPDPTARFNVMVLHGEVQGMPNHGHPTATEISEDEIKAPAWDYIALGHYHVYQQLAPNMYYSGAIDYTSSNPWGELTAEAEAGLPGKGFAERDLVTGQQTFHPLPASRQLIEVDSIDAMGMGAADLDHALRSALEGCDMDDAIVRLVVHNVPVEIGRALDQRSLREFKRRALNLNLDLRRPERVTMASGRVRMRGQSLEDIVGDYLSGRFELPGDVDRGELAALAALYLDKARDPTGDTVALIEAHANEAAA